MLSLENTPFAGQGQEDLDSLLPTSPCEPKVLQAHLARCEAERVYHSVSIEGNSLTLPEVSEVLDGNVTITGKPLHDSDEVKRLARALRYVGAIIAQNAGRPTLVTEVNLLDLHALVLGEAGGSYRSVRVYIANSKTAFPSPMRVAQKMEELLRWLPAVRSHPVMGSLVVHTWFVQIHPFIDGNGRIARLLAELILRAHGLPPVVIPVEQKHEYFKAVESAWSDLSPLARLWRRCFEESLKKYRALRALSSPNIDEENGS